VSVLLSARWPELLSYKSPDRVRWGTREGTSCIWWQDGPCAHRFNFALYDRVVQAKREALARAR
jgi:hypothetical protein